MRVQVPLLEIGSSPKFSLKLLKIDNEFTDENYLIYSYSVPTKVHPSNTVSSIYLSFNLVTLISLEAVRRKLKI